MRACFFVLHVLVKVILESDSGFYTYVNTRQTVGSCASVLSSPCMRLGTAAPRWGGATRRHRTEHSVYHASSPCRRVWALLVSKYTRLHAWHIYVLVRYPAHTNLLAGLHRIERHGRGEPLTPSPGKIRHGLVPNHESLQQLPQCHAGRDYYHYSVFYSRPSSISRL